MSTKHTPGPWKVKRLGTISDADGGVVATCGFRVAVGSDEDDANVNLIAAAPDLLEACRAAAEFFAGTDAPLGELLRAAIAKAEGRS